MVKVCLLMVLTIAFTISIFGQTAPQQSNQNLAVNSVKKDPVPTVDETASPAMQTQPETENKSANEAAKIEEAKNETSAAAEEKTVKIPEVKRNEQVTAAHTSAAPQLLPKKAKGLGSYTTGNQQFDRYITDASEKYGVDPLLIFAQMKQESSFKLKATSHKGASGLMQLMPDTARRFGVRNIYSPKQNIDAGVKYMRWLLDKFSGDVSLALAGYNAGEGAVMKYGNKIPPYRETKDYVKRITAHYAEITTPIIETFVNLDHSNQQIAKSF
jgi:soluble lytic murein transglycosylase-like protein